MITEKIIEEQLIDNKRNSLFAINPKTQKRLEGTFPIATATELNTAIEEANKAFKTYKNVSGKKKAEFLRTIANEIEGLGNELIERVQLETALPEGRVIGERGRTCNQLRQFADLVEKGNWVEATIDEAIPDRQPLPKEDIRKMLRPIGSVAVFTASNFPLAFSTAGGDTASALAAGCPVIVKAHPSHLGTNALVATAILRAIEKCELPKGVFASLNGEIETGSALVKHPLVKAVGFTGSFRGGKALFDLANSRPEPIPVYAEMGSVNPVFLLEEFIKIDTKRIAETLANSVNLGAGQFCTNPGVFVVQKNENTEGFIEYLKEAFTQLVPANMLNEGIYKSYNKAKHEVLNDTTVNAEFINSTADSNWCGSPAFATVNAQEFINNSNLQEEVFGPFTLGILCDTKEEMEQVAASLKGQLTASFYGTENDLHSAVSLIETITEKVGRVIFNGVPTGVEVCPAMHHGGPFPASSNALYTSVGTDAIKRFARPVSYQNTPDFLLPDELKRGNPLKINRVMNGK